jgi:hypothetical protein
MTTDTEALVRRAYYRVGDLDLNRTGYGAMQFAGSGVFGPPRGRAAARPRSEQRMPTEGRSST